MAKDKELADHERAHSGVAGSKVRHGADATGKVPKFGSQEFHDAHVAKYPDIPQDKADAYYKKQDIIDKGDPRFGSNTPPRFKYRD